MNHPERPKDLPGIHHGYGFVEHTLADDGDPLGALVILDEPTFPDCLISCRAIGMFRLRVIEMSADAAGIGLTIHPDPMLSETVGMAAEASEGTIAACTCRRGDSRRRGLCQLQVARPLALGVPPLRAAYMRAAAGIKKTSRHFAGRL